MDRKKAVELHQAVAQVAFRNASAKGLGPDAVVVLLVDLDDRSGATIGRGLMPGESAKAEQGRATGCPTRQLRQETVNVVDSPWHRNQTEYGSGLGRLWRRTG